MIIGELSHLKEMLDHKTILLSEVRHAIPFNTDIAVGFKSQDTRIDIDNVGTAITNISFIEREQTNIIPYYRSIR